MFALGALLHRCRIKWIIACVARFALCALPFNAGLLAGISQPRFMWSNAWMWIMSVW